MTHQKNAYAVTEVDNNDDKVLGNYILMLSDNEYKILSSNVVNVRYEQEDIDNMPNTSEKVITQLFFDADTKRSAPDTTPIYDKFTLRTIVK